MATKVGQIKNAKVSPAFLHGNSTSHTWPFSAVAELIDNAYDPDVNASELWIDRRTINRTECLTFVDNGNGMDENKLYKMLSFGYCEKVQVGDVKPIGYYGNGFKSGSMRLGADALVFTRSKTSTSIGFLSQTYLKNINADAVAVPIVTWKFMAGSMVRVKSQDSNTNLNAILRHSLFTTENALVAELKTLEGMETGTNIIIYNLRKDRSGNLEIDFVSDEHDIRNPETPLIDLTTINRPVYTPTLKYRQSLREYCSILYLKPRMKIVLRGKKVITKLISKSLSQTEHDVYKPTWLNGPIRITFGFVNKREPDSYGLMMYHKNRLIRAYEKIGCQKQANNHGEGVLGVCEVNFLEPVHNKQEFNRTDKYMAFMQNAGNKLNDYYFEKTQNENPNQQAGESSTNPVTVTSQLPDWTWAQCDNCLSWRRLPTGYSDKLPAKWFCYLNPDAHFNRCDIREEPEDDEEALQSATYIKTFKITKEVKKRQAKAEEERRVKEKEALLDKKWQYLKKKEQEITRKQPLVEVSSSQDKLEKKPTIADLEKTRKDLQEKQELLAMSEKTIKALEQQNILIEQKSQAMLRMAGQINITKSQSTMLMEKAEALEGAGSKETSTSQGLRAPLKRKSDGNANSSSTKTMKIKTEDGSGIIDEAMGEPESGHPDIEQPDIMDTSAATGGGDANQTSSPTRSKTPDKTMTNNKPNEKSSVQKPKPVETSEKGKDGVKTSTKNATDNYTEMTADEDVKPDKDELDSGKKSAKTVSETKTSKNASENLSKSVEQIETPSKTVEQSPSTSTEETQSEREEKKTEINTKDILTKTEIKKEMIDKRSQTVPVVVKFASDEEVKLDNLSPLEQKQLLLQKTRELQETNTSLKSFKNNVWKLLKIIVEDFDYGDADNIENVIIDFINAHEEQSTSNAD